MMEKNELSGWRLVFPNWEINKLSHLFMTDLEFQLCVPRVVFHGSYFLKENLTVVIDEMQLSACYWAPQFGQDIKVRLFIGINKKSTSMWKLSPSLASVCLVYIHSSGGTHCVLFSKSLLSFFFFPFFFFSSCPTYLTWKSFKAW